MKTHFDPMILLSVGLLALTIGLALHHFAAPGPAREFSLGLLTGLSIVVNAIYIYLISRKTA